MNTNLGWKTITGIIFDSITAAIIPLQPLFTDVTWIYIMAVTGGLGVFFTGIGIVHKYAKAKETTQ